MIAQSKTASLQLKASEKANFNHLIGDIAWFGLAMAATSRFLSVYAIRLGATPVDLGWISALPALLMLVSASFGAWWTHRYGNPVRSLFLPGLGMRLMFLLPAFAPFFPPHLQPLWLIVSVSLPALPQGIAAVAFFVVMRGSIDPSHMTHLLSRRQLAVNICVAVAALTFGLWLKGVPFPLNYQVMFLVAFALSLGSLYHCIRIRVEDQKRATAEMASVISKPVAPKPVVIRRATKSFAQTLVKPWRSTSFRRVGFLTALIHISFFFLVPVVPLFLVNHLGADEGYMAVFALVELAAGATASILAPRVTARIGTRPMIALAMVGTALSAIIIALAPNLYIALFAAIFSGGCWTAAAGVGIFTYFVDNTPAEEMSTYSTAFHQVIGMSVFIGPMLGSLLANGGTNLILLMMFGAAIRLFAAPLIESTLFARWRARAQGEPVPHPL
jgi:MFS family permease